MCLFSCCPADMPEVQEAGLLGATSTDFELGSPVWLQSPQWPDLQTYPHSPFLIVPSWFVVTISLSFLWLPNSGKRRKKFLKKSASQWLALSSCRRNEGLDLTCPCLLFFGLFTHWRNNGNWPAASLESSLASSFPEPRRGLWGCSVQVWAEHRAASALLFLGKQLLLCTELFPGKGAGNCCGNCRG